MPDIETIAAQLEIRNLYARYCFSLDGNDLDALAGCFSPDGVFDLGDRGAFEGRDSIRALIGRTTSGRPRHHGLNIEVLDATGTRGEGRAYFLLVDTETGDTVSYGHYHDTMSPGDDGVWRFDRRLVTFLWQADEYTSRARD